MLSWAFLSHFYFVQIQYWAFAPSLLSFFILLWASVFSSIFFFQPIHHIKMRVDFHNSVIIIVPFFFPLISFDYMIFFVSILSLSILAISILFPLRNHAWAKRFFSKNLSYRFHPNMDFPEIGLIVKGYLSGDLHFILLFLRFVFRTFLFPVANNPTLKAN